MPAKNKSTPKATALVTATPAATPVTPHFVGIDVSAKTLDVCITHADKIISQQTLANTAAAHKQLCTQLGKYPQAQVVMEATGVYHLDAALALSNASIPLMIANPKSAANFAKVLLKNGKTDKSDAKLLAQYAQRMTFIPWQRPSKNALQLHQIARRLFQITTLKTAEKNRLHALNIVEHMLDILTQTLLEHVASLEKQAQQLLEAALVLVNADPDLKRKLDLIDSIPGFAVNSAVQILAHLLLMPPTLTAKQWVKMAGLDPRAFQSGTSINRKTRISKTGNKHLRMALYMPALSAKTHNPHIKAYFEHLTVDLHKTPKQALIAVMRKLLHTIHAVIAHNTPFQQGKFYTMPKTHTENVDF